MSLKQWARRQSSCVASQVKSQESLQSKLCAKADGRATEAFTRFSLSALDVEQVVSLSAVG